MWFFPVKIPKLITRIFPNYVWGFSPKEKVIYLTFDDGPTPEITQWTLNTLKQFNAKATFFCIGNNVKKYPEILNTILAEKHSIGNHTFNHITGWKTDTKKYIENVIKTETIINKELINSKVIPKLFRPPFGKIKNSQGKALMQLGYKIIMWSVVTYDWEQKLSKEQCLKNAISKTTNGNIVVFHDSIKASKNMQFVLPKFLAYFSEKGYIFKAITA